MLTSECIKHHDIALDGGQTARGVVAHIGDQFGHRHRAIAGGHHQ